MYSEVLEFFVVSKDLWMLQVMQKMEPMEDCIYHFAMKPDVGEVCETLSGRNMAVIIDSGMISEQVENALKHWAKEKDALTATGKLCWEERRRSLRNRFIRMAETTSFKVISLP